jgi:UDP-N-acetylmuramate dehydrogenase
MEIADAFPVFCLGSGANILVSDQGVRGIVLDMTSLTSCSIAESQLYAGAGLAISEAARFAADKGFAGLEFIYSMPGSVGGSVWMNARCYGTSVSDVLAFADIVDRAGALRRIIPNRDDFAYKVSPFQSQKWIIVAAGFNLHRDDHSRIRRRMNEHEQDRKRKGHFAAPSAGSVFKNNRYFGEPTGKIIDSLGLRGMRNGGAMVSEFHANIIVNAGGATAQDILRLMEFVERRVKDTLGFNLEREVLLVGEWNAGY